MIYPYHKERFRNRHKVIMRVALKAMVALLLGVWSTLTYAQDAPPQIPQTPQSAQVSVNIFQEAVA